MRRPRPFWSLVDKSAGPDACRPWQGRRDPQGYGVYDAGGKGHRAIRVALELHAGESVTAPAVRHRCDNAPCCNPAHLTPGTAADNNRDMYERGREARKLTREQHAEIKRLCAAGGRGIQTKVAREFGVTPQHVGRLVRSPAASQGGGA